jgi:hypothetical protein
MATIAHRTSTAAEPAALRTGAALMALAALGFIGYAVIFFVRNFTGAFLELGIGPEQVDVGRDEIRAFSGDLYHYVAHLTSPCRASSQPPGSPPRRSRGSGYGAVCSGA